MIFKHLPLSVNAMYGGRKYLTSKGKAIREAIAWEARMQWKGKELGGELAVRAVVYFPDRKRRDIDNILKCLLDSLTGIAWVDDSQIVSLTLERYLDRTNPRLELEVVEIEEGAASS